MTRIKMALGAEIYHLLGAFISANRIYTDENGGVYIPPRSLEPGHPIIFMDFHGHLNMLIPTSDNDLLEKGEKSVREYVQTAIWNYGYYWGWGSFLHNVFWQPLEPQGGIHDVRLVSNYLEVLKRRATCHYGNQAPDKNNCTICKITECPFNLANNHQDFTWNYLVPENDERKKLLKYVKKTIKKQFGFKVTLCQAHDMGPYIIMEPSKKDREVFVRLPYRTLISLLNHPNRFDLKGIVEDWEFKFKVPGFIKNEDNKFVETRFIGLKTEDKKTVYKLWSIDGNPNYVKEWSTEQIYKAKKKPGLLARIKQLFSHKPATKKKTAA